MNGVEDLLNNTLGCLYLVGVFSVMCVYYNYPVLILTSITDFMAAHAARSCTMPHITFPNKRVRYTSQFLYVTSSQARIIMNMNAVSTSGCLALVGKRQPVYFGNDPDTSNRVLDTAKTLVDLAV